MFFSANTLEQYYKANPSRKPHTLTSGRKIREYVKVCKAGILARDLDTSFVIDRSPYWGDECQYVGKWLRPWDVVPAIKNFTVPANDYGIGIEVEMGFTSLSSAQFIAKAISNWRHITIDEEGGDYPLEVTFPPVLYSKLSSNSQPCRYLQLLDKNSDKVAKHDWYDRVGIHVNVSKGGVTFYDEERIYEVSEILECYLTEEQNMKFFNREPYGYGHDCGKYVEWKLFNSVTDYKVLKRYINIAVALTDLVASDVEINESAVMNALNNGYNKRV